MPMDPFFTSANKRYYIEDPEATKLIEKIKAMSYDETTAWYYQFSRLNPERREPTRIEQMVMKSLRVRHAMKRRAKVRYTGEKQVTKAIEELHAGKRDKIRVFGGFGTIASRKPKKFR